MAVISQKAKSQPGEEEKSGRKWIYAKKPQGKFTNYRNYVSYLLLALLFSGPFLRINGHPLLMINIIERKFVILGAVFWPQDMYILVLLFLTMVVFVILFTVVFGRLFCGWVCPQTIFMEMVFRKIEYWIEGDYTKQKALDKEAWTGRKIAKKSAKHIIFYGISVLIANVFLAYIIGSEAVINIVTESPLQHLGGFTALVVFSSAFYMVFAFMREQVCILACPYGRLQGVMIDPNTVVVAYDNVRGEPRGKMRKGEERLIGDCIDCMQCVQVCPTGIDIRKGTQLECINCTACIDACDDIMTKINQPTGLIRYDSMRGIQIGRKFSFFKLRPLAYTGVLLVLMGIVLTLLLLRTSVDSSISRAKGTLYQTQPNGNISNLYNIKVINKTYHDMTVRIKLLSHEKGMVKMVGSELGEVKVPAEGLAEGVLFVELPKSELKSVNVKIELGVFNGNELVETMSTKFLAPF